MGVEVLFGWLGFFVFILCLFCCCCFGLIFLWVWGGGWFVSGCFDLFFNLSILVIYGT